MFFQAKGTKKQKQKLSQTHPKIKLDDRERKAPCSNID
jgi:hypothetical protein